MAKYTYEYTDTFGGEANYIWCRRGTIEATSDRAAVRKAKAAVGLTGCPCRRDDGISDIVLRPSGMCTVLFIDQAE
jgi:hypothetical protein